MAERVAGAGLGEELAVLVLRTFADHDDAVFVFLDALTDPLEERAFVERDLREQDDVRRLARAVAGQSAGRGDPAGMPSHDFEDEDLGGRLRHRQHVQCGFLGRNGNVFGDRAEARAVVGDRQIVVDGLGDAEAGTGKPIFREICDTLWAVSIESLPPL